MVDLRKSYSKKKREYGEIINAPIPLLHRGCINRELFRPGKYPVCAPPDRAISYILAIGGI